MAKKLTTAKYKAHYRAIIKKFKDMFNDRIEYADSKSPMSAKKILDTIIMLQQAQRRIK